MGIDEYEGDECYSCQGAWIPCDACSPAPRQSTHHLDVIAKMPKAKGYERKSLGSTRIQLHIIELVHTTGKALLVLTKEFGEIWLPTKYIKYNKEAWTIPLWLFRSCADKRNKA